MTRKHHLFEMQSLLTRWRDTTAHRHCVNYQFKNRQTNNMMLMQTSSAPHKTTSNQGWCNPKITVWTSPRAFSKREDTAIWRPWKNGHGVVGWQEEPKNNILEGWYQGVSNIFPDYLITFTAGLSKNDFALIFDSFKKKPTTHKSISSFLSMIWHYFVIGSKFENYWRFDLENWAILSAEVF